MNAARSFGRFDAVILAATSKLRQVWLSAIAMLVSAVLSLPSALAAPGDVDALNLNIVGSFVYASAVQPDGKTIIGGQFSSVLGQARNNIARLNADGTLDAGFNPNANGSVESVALQADGQILLGGFFTTIAGSTRNRIARVAADGTLDAGFNPNANGNVRSIAVQADGQILLGGDFTTVGGSTRNRIARVAANGTLDVGFNPNANATVYSIAIQADGQILLGGSFITIGGSTRNFIARVAANGTLDASFTPNANFDVISIAVQANGQILFVGFFTTVNGVTRDRIARLAANGTLDMGFNPVPNSNVFSIALQADGRILFGGEFTSVGGTTRNRIARVAADGMLDLGFNPNVNGDVRNITLQANGQILLGDVFTTVGGSPRNRFARLLNDPATQSLNAVDTTQVLWTRGGSAPELGQATFELSTNGGVSYTPLGGIATRVGITANWQLTGLSLPASGQLRARGRTAGGFGNGSTGLVEQVAVFSLADITSNLQARYACDGNALDSSGGLRHLGPSFGALSFAVDGRYGQACQFDGFTRVKSANSAFTQSNAVTYAYWIKKTTPRTGQETIMQTVTGAGTSNVQNSIDFETSPARQRIWSNNATFPFTISTVPGPTLFDSTWHHVAITSTGPSSSVQIYIDGAAVMPVTLMGSNSVADLATTFYLGARSDLLSNDLAVYQGAMDDVRIYSRVLTPFDILDLAAPPGIGDVIDTTINEDASTGALNFSVNDLQTPASSLQVVASSSNPSLVPQPNITLGGSGNTRTVSVLPALNQSGTSIITLAVTDADFRTSNINFVLTVDPVNDAPSFVAGANQTVLEDAGPQSIPGWATAVDDGDPESVQALNFVVTPISGTVNFSVFPTISPSGTLSYTSAPDSIGSASFSVRLDDNGGTANGGVDQSADQTFTISVGPVNDAPTFTAGTNQSVLEDAGPQSIPNWATALDDGDPESLQSLNFFVTPISGTVNFSVFPTISPSGTLSYSSAPDSVGSASFSVRLDDNGGTANGGVDQSADQTFTISVGPVNDAPTVTAISNLNINENTTSAPIAFTINDAETAPGALGLVAGSDNPTLFPGGNIVFGGSGANRTITITPAPNEFGVANFQVIVDDGQASSTSNFVVTVNAVNDVPTVTAISNLNINEDTTSAPIAFTINDAETAPGALGLVAGSDNPTLFPGGNIVFGGSGANRTITITPAPNEFGVANFQVIVDDGQASSTSNFVVTVNAVNDAPTVTAISNLSTPEDNATAPIAITLGDLDNPVASLTLSATSSNPSLVPVGNVVFGGTGANRTAVITPEPNQSGTATITVTVSDGSDTTSQSFTLTVTSVNDAPTIAALSNLSTPEDNATAPIAITLGDLDNPVASLTLSATSSNPSLVPVGNVVFGGTGANRTAVITPEPNQSGTATITVTVSDGSDTTSQSFTLTVTSVNDAPTIAALSNLSTPEDNATAPIAITLGDLDNPVASLTLSATSSNPSLVPVGNVVFGGTGANRTAVITPEPNQSGTATITVTVSDGSDTTSQSFTLTVTSVNDAPTIAALSNLSTPEDNATAPIAITLGDLDNPVASLTLSATSSNPSLVPVGNVVFGGAGANRTAVITPAPDQSGTATITVTVSDGSDTTSQSFTLTVTSVNDAPTIAALSNLSTPEDNATAPIAITLGDLDNPVASLTLSATSSNPSLVPVGNVVFGGAGANRTAVITPAPDQSGTATITVTVSDGSDTTSQSFTLTVTSVNDAPTIAALSNLSTPEDNATAPIAITLGDLDNPVASLTLSATSSNPSLVPVGNVVFGGTGANRTAVITPEPNQSGTATITVTVSDGSDTTSQSFTLTVTSVNDAPTIAALSNLSTPEDNATAPIAITLGDLDNPVASLTLSATSSNPSLVPVGNVVFGGAGANRTAVITPAPDQSGTATITVTVSDGSDTTSQSFTLTVTSVNDAPTIAALSNLSTPEDNATAPIAITLGDLDNPVASLTLSATSSNPSLVPVGNVVFGGTGANRTAVITPEPNQSGTATITVTVSDGSDTTSQSFTLTVTSVNDAPTIAALSNLSTPEDNATAPIAITLGDLDNPVASLTLSATSSNPSLVPVGNVVFGGTGANRTAVITPEPNQSGTATITVTVSDGSDTTSQSFTLTVTSVNDAPTIAALSNLSTPEDNATAPIAITLGDLDNPVASLTLSATSSNPSLVPVGNVVFGGTGANRTAVITPEPNQSGTATITVTVSDGTDTSARTFTLTVNPVNDLPSFTAGPNQSLLFATNTAQTISNWATAITDGDPDFVQGLSFNVSNSNNALFSVQPSIAVNGTLSYTTTGASGTAIVSVSLTDDATAGGPALSTATITFSITVAINTPPSLSAVSAQSTNEDTTTVAIAFTVSDIETPVNALVVTALSSNTSLIPLANIVFAGTGSNRSLSITPTANRSGTSTITLNLSDGTDSSSRSFVLTVNPINDLPSFIKGANQVIAPGITGVQSISNWASAIDDGDADFTQALSFNLSSDNPSLFASQPSVSATGTLSFTPAGIAGIATVSISLTDDASAGGSALTTVAQSFTITIQAVPVVSVEQRSPTSTVVGQPFTVRVRVRNPTGSLAPTGTVSVTPLPVGITVQCSLTAVATPPGSAEALCTNVISPIAAAKLVLAVYEGNPVFLAADASDTHTVDKAATLLRILEDLPDPSPSNTPVAVRYQLEVLAPSVAPLSSLNGIITLSDGSNQTSAPFSLSNPVISLVLQGNGPRVLTLRYSSDSNFLDSSATETHTLTGGNSTDLAVTVSNGKRYVQSGGEAIYLISVRNLGGINSSAQLNAFVPAGLSNYRYTCTASAGSSCHAASGTGAIIAAINVAAGGEVTYTVRADVVATEPANITHSALIVPAAAPPDTNPSNDVASDTDFVGLYSDGFEN